MVMGRVAEVGSLSARAKMGTKVFVRRVFAIFAKKSFLGVIANLININMQYIPYHSAILPEKHCFYSKKKIVCQKSSKSV